MDCSETNIRSISPVFDSAAETDLIGYDNVVETIHNFCTRLQYNEYASFSIGLFGEWGSGKTSSLLQIRRKLLDDNNIAKKESEGLNLCVWVNPWAYKTEEEAFTALVSQIYISIESHLKQFPGDEEEAKILQKVVGKLKDVARSFSKLASRVESAGVAGLSLGLRGNEGEDFSIHSLAKGLKRTRLYIFVDDLDRCSPELSIGLLESVKTLLDVPNFVYLMALDLHAIELAFQTRYQGRSEKFKTWLDKLIQLPVPLPAPDKSKVETEILAPRLMVDADEYYELITSIIGTNPRSIKRYINKVHFYSTYAASDSRKCSVESAIKLALIDHKLPEVFKELSPNPSLLIAIQENIRNSSDISGAEDAITTNNSRLKKVLDDRSKSILYRILATRIDENPLKEEELRAQPCLTLPLLPELNPELHIGESIGGANTTRQVTDCLPPADGVRLTIRNEDSEGQPFRVIYVSCRLATQQILELAGIPNNCRWRGPDLPIESLSWWDMVGLCNKLSKMYDRQQVYEIEDSRIIVNRVMNGFRLPTDTEWVALAENENYSAMDLDEYAWHLTNSEAQTQEVALKKPNVLGVYDLFGNVWEVTEAEGSVDVSVLKNTLYKRGGSWSSFRNTLSVDHREALNPNTKKSNIGFRLVITESLK